MTVCTPRTSPGLVVPDTVVAGSEPVPATVAPGCTVMPLLAASELSATSVPEATVVVPE